MPLNGLRAGFEARRRQVRFLLGAPYYGVVDVVVAYLTVNQSERVRFPTTPQSNAALADVVIAPV